MRGRISSTALCAAALAVVAATGCEGGGKSDSPPPVDPKPAPPPVKAGSNIQRVAIAVPYGKQVACADVIDKALFARYVSGEIGEVKDRAGSNSEATLSCAFMRAGKPPSTDAQLRKYQREGQRLGVMPGDEYCLVTAYCSMATDEERFKKKCDEDKDVVNESVGQFACVHTSQRGTRYAYTYRVIDPDTRCTLEIMGGPSVTDEPLVQNCTRAALEDITLPELKNFH